MKWNVMCLISLILGMTIMVGLLLVLESKLNTEIQVQALIFNILTLSLGFYIASVVNRRNQARNSISSIHVNQLNRYINTLCGLQSQIYEKKQTHLYNVVSIIKLLRSNISITGEDVDKRALARENDVSYKQKISEQFSKLNTMLTDVQYCTTIGKPNCLKIEKSVINISDDYLHEICHQIEVCIALIYSLQISITTEQ